MRLKDVDLTSRFINVQPEGAKNVYRVRVIPLNEEAFKAAILAVARARKPGSAEPNHYLFPFRIHRSLFDPGRHQTGFKGAWKKLTEAAGITGLRPGEILSLSLKDVGLDPPHISIPRRGAKRVSRERHLELNGTAASALERLMRRATDECKCTLPEHYLSPRRNRDHAYDPTQPAQGYRGGLRELLAIAEVKVRRYDFRDHAVSRALSNPQVSLEAARSYFGWMSPKMVQRYYHANQAAMRVVAAALDEKPPEPARQQSLGGRPQ